MTTIPAARINRCTRCGEYRPAHQLRYGRCCGPRSDTRTRNRLEDLAWMAETGETLEGAAERLDITPKSLERWCRRHAPHLYVTLTRGTRA